MAAKQAAGIFAVTESGKVDKLVAKPVAKPVLAAKYTSLTPITVNGQMFLLGYAAAQDHFDVYQFTPKAPWLKPVPAKAVIGAGQDIINAFSLGNVPYVCAYTKDKGIFDIYSVSNDLSFSAPYKFYRNHELAISHNFSTVKPFVQAGEVAFLGYRIDTGYVALYSVNVAVAGPAPGEPPLQMLPIWSHPWAPGWTRFAFFYLGGEPFFFKTNIKVLNVNIDHVLDTLPNGTSEVGTNLQKQLADATKLTNVEPFTMAHGEPYFVTYIAKTGAATLNRFHADCMGWTTVAKFKAPVNAAVVTPVTVNNNVFLVFA